ncbi:MAG TPA: enoyl-CoA hydratase-related protein [Acidimicrobiia bacterium]|nr:enoyl-CoA hydratase-related protein [Acidimicrobiia bacterium]
MTYEFIEVDDPVPQVRRITLNRPDKRNAINNRMRAELFAALEAADTDASVHVSIVRGSGACFSSGYDLKATGEERPYYTAAGDGSWSRHVTEGWTRIWDLAKPVIAQVHGYAMAGGTELVAACDLVYVARDATFSYPVVRIISPPDFQYHPWLVGMRNAMELVLTGDPITGEDAARMGLANRAFEEKELEEKVLGIAQRIAGIPAELLQINKRSVHRAMEIMGIRTGLRAGSELQALAARLPSVQALLAGDAVASVKRAAGDRAGGPQ